SGPDANLDRASLQMQRASVGATVVKAPQDLSGQMADFYADDGAGGYTKVAGELMPPDTFTAPIMTGKPPASFALPDNIPRLWALPARAQKGTYVVYEHPNPTEAASTSQIMLTATLPSGYVTGESFRVLAVGAWMQYALVAADLPAPDTAVVTIS